MRERERGSEKGRERGREGKREGERQSGDGRKTDRNLPSGALFSQQPQWPQLSQA